MEGRVSRGRGGGWRRGGRGGHDGDGGGGDHRGRGRGGHNRGRGRRDHHRGRGRGGGGDHAAGFHNQDQGDGDSAGEEDNRREAFSRRKLESNWDRYEESERQEPDDDMPAQRGRDYHVLLESAGDSFTQFRFVDEKDWEMDSFTATQMSTVAVDLPSLAQTLQQLPLHQRLNLEAELLLQVLTPVDLPALIPAPTQEMTSRTSTVTQVKVLSGSGRVDAASMSTNTPLSSKAAELPVDAGDEELDLLLSLDKPVTDTCVHVTDEDVENVSEKVKEVPAKATEEKTEEVKDVPPLHTPTSAESKGMTEEDLEDWLDSMIS